MSNSADQSVTQMIQALSSLHLSSEQFQHVLQSPERMTELIRRASDADPGHPDLSENEIIQELCAVRARWEAEACLPPQKPQATRRIDLESTNQVLALRMSSPYFLKTYVGQEKSFSTTPITQLRVVSLGDMLARKIHKGHYLLCRTIFKPVRQVAVELSVEDPNGDVILLALYNFPGLFLANAKVLEAHFPIGTIMAIREPWMKFPSTLSQQNAMIRVDSPSDVVILEPSNPVLQRMKWKTSPTVNRHRFTSAAQWKELGNQHFKDDLFVPAALAWSRGLELAPSMHSLRLNRSQAYIKLQWFSAALVDAVHVLSTPESSTQTTKKASYRAASAEYGLGRYRDALVRLETLDEGTDIKSFKARCRDRSKEAEMGEYAWMDMFHAGQHTVPHLDVAEFVSPAVATATILTRGGGRGIRSMRDIKAGELLIVAKPFASVFPAELPKGTDVCGLNFVTQRSNKTTSIALITRVIARMHGCPEESDLMYNLYSGPRRPLPPPSYPPTLLDNLTPITPLSWKVDIDVARIDGIVSYNSFSPNCVKKVTTETHMPTNQSPEMETPSAIYTLPSLFNHSCHPNAVWRCFGDVMVIRARERILRGTEITLSYASGITYIERGEKLRSLLLGPCDCALCVSDRADGDDACRRRKKLVEERQAAKLDTIRRMGKSIADSMAAQAHVQSMASTYRSNHGLPRPPLFHAYFDAMQALEFEANRNVRFDLMKQSIKQGVRALEAAGFTEIDATLAGGKLSRRTLPLSKKYLATSLVDIDVCILIMAHLSASFTSLSQSIRAERWLRAAWWVHDASFGGGRALFYARLGSSLDVMPLPSIQYGWD